MKLYKNETQVVKILYKIKCNCCGKDIETDTFGYNYDCLSIEKKWGYQSSFDNKTHRFDICEDCYKKFIDTFKIPVESD